MNDNELKIAIESGDVQRVSALLDAEPALARGTIRWVLNRENQSDPLHFVSDCVSNGTIGDECAAEIARLLIAKGAAVDGTEGRETPLIGAVSLGAEAVAASLIAAGADIAKTAVFGATPLHWAAWMGMPATVESLIAHGSDIEARCAEFGATPVFWAAHGFGPSGPGRGDQTAAAACLIEAGANLSTANKHGVSLIDLASGYEDKGMLKAVSGTTEDSGNPVA